MLIIFSDRRWVTEYGFPEQSLEDTQDFYNQSSAFFDRIEWVPHLPQSAPGLSFFAVLTQASQLHHPLLHVRRLPIRRIQRRAERSNAHARWRAHRYWSLVSGQDGHGQCPQGRFESRRGVCWVGVCGSCGVFLVFGMRLLGMMSVSMNECMDGYRTV